MAIDSRLVTPDISLYVYPWIESQGAENNHNAQNKEEIASIFQLIADNESRVLEIDALRNRDTPVAALQEEIEGRCKELDLKPTHCGAKDGSLKTVAAALALQHLTSGNTQSSGTKSGDLERLWRECEKKKKKRNTTSPVHGTSQDPSSHLSCPSKLMVRSAVIAYLYCSTSSEDAYFDFIRSITLESFEKGTVVRMLVPLDSGQFVDDLEAEGFEVLFNTQSVKGMAMVVDRNQSGMIGKPPSTTMILQTQSDSRGFHEQRCGL